MVKRIKNIFSFCFTWNNLWIKIVNSYSSLIDIGTASGHFANLTVGGTLFQSLATNEGTCSRRDAYMSILPKELNKNHSHLMFRWANRLRGRLDWSLVLVCLGVSSFVTVLKGWSIYNLKTNWKVNRKKINKLYLFYWQIGWIIVGLDGGSIWKDWTGLIETHLIF